jgi:membrane associated rhomboid family serine protease
MIPLRDNQPTSTFPIVTILLIAANVVVFLAQQIIPGFNDSFTMVPFRVMHAGQDLSGYVARMTTHGPLLMHVPSDVTDIRLRQNEVYFGPVPFDIRYTVFTAMFMHAGLLHIAGNMLFLWIFGNNIEDALGKIRYIIFYFACGIAAAAAQILPDPNSIVPTLGASGAIAGVLGAYLVLYPEATVLTWVPIWIGLIFPLPAWLVLGLWFILQLFPGVLSLGAPTGHGGVAYFAHIGGFIAGFMLIKLLGGDKIRARQRQRAFARNRIRY